MDAFFQHQEREAKVREAFLKHARGSNIVVANAELVELLRATGAIASGRSSVEAEEFMPEALSKEGKVPGATLSFNDVVRLHNLFLVAGFSGENRAPSTTMSASTMTASTSRAPSRLLNLSRSPSPGPVPAASS